METHPIILDHRPDIRLIACDLDGTLLDDDHAIHDEFWPLIDQLHSRGIIFCPASGRQYFNLLERFKPIENEVIFVAENGSYVVRDGKELSSDCIDKTIANELFIKIRELEHNGTNAGAVLCGKRSAYIERTDAAFRTEVSVGNHRLEIVDDLLLVEDDILKVAVFDFVSAELCSAPAFEAYRKRLQVVVSGQHWLDFMNLQTNKGAGIRHIQNVLGITPDQTMVFGDFLNDLEMMDVATYSFAMANAHPTLKEHARFISPSNVDNGVVRTIKSVLGLE